ncbi:DUF4062 domain-containing protein [Schumannella luteola]
MSKSELRVFLASPGGLEAERDAIEQLAGKLNANFSDRLNVTITVRRFEQRAARSGRPQSQINPWVDDCDLLIAIVHRRWGSPSGKGDHTGFSEEFDRAIERFESTGHPVVSLHFKAVDPESEADAGPQLAQVMAFRRRIETEHMGLYANFDSIDGLRVNVMQLLLEEMHAVSEANVLPDDGSATSAPVATDPTVPPKPEVQLDESGMAEVLQTVADVIRGEPTERLLELDRLVLFAKGVAKDEEVANVHLVNRTFMRRGSIKLSEWELLAWFRTFVSDHGRAESSEDRVVPFMLSVGRDRLVRQLNESAGDLLASDIEYVQKGYLRLLTAFRERPEELWPSDSKSASSRWAELSTRGLRTDILNYWAAVGSAADLPGVDLLLANRNPAVSELGRALLALIDADLPIDPLFELDAGVLVSPVIAARLGNTLLGRASTEALQELMERKYLDIEVRKVIIPEIATRGAWTSKMVQSVISDESFGGYFGDSWEPLARALLFGTPEPEVIDLIVEEASRLGPVSQRMVLAQLAAANATYRRAYEAQGIDHLAIGQIEEYFAAHAHDQSIQREAHEVIAGVFQPATRRLERLRAAGAEEDLVAFVEERQVAAALMYIADSGSRFSPAASQLLRSAAGRSGRLKYDLVMVLERTAKDADIPALLEMSPSRWRGDAARLGRLLSRATLKRLLGLLDHEMPDIVLGALAELDRRERLPSRRRRKELLRHPDANVRLLALSTLARDMADPAGFIDEYVHDGPSYYYNVVCELDRIASGSPKVY